MARKDRPTEREINLHCARVYLREATARRERSPAFSATLLQWAANARRRAAEASDKPDPKRPAQGELF